MQRLDEEQLDVFMKMLNEFRSEMYAYNYSMAQDYLDSIYEDMKDIEATRKWEEVYEVYDELCIENDGRR